jgi:putative Mg2+ transporter-C (MgtC) family protein
MRGDWEAVWHLGVALLIGYVLGFEREIRGAAAGARVFSLIGIGGGVVGMLALHGAPNALAGVVTGVGFIGGGLVFGQDIGREHLVRGITTAASIFAAAGLSAAAGQGHILLSVVGAVFAIIMLEIRHLKPLRYFDPRYWAPRFRDDPIDAVPRTEDAIDAASGDEPDPPDEPQTR